MVRPSLGVILAGGGARRLGGADKGRALLAGKQLFDHVFKRLTPQVDRIIIAGPHDYGAGIIAVEDKKDGPAGPAAGLYATLHWLTENAPDMPAFLTTPVDAPFLSRDLARRLCAESGSTVARCGGRRHPTFAYWNARDLSAFFQSSDRSDAPALHEIAAAVNARDVDFDHDAAFFNVNTPADLNEAEAMLAERD